MYEGHSHSRTLYEAGPSLSALWQSPLWTSPVADVRCEQEHLVDVTGH